MFRNGNMHKRKLEGKKEAFENLQAALLEDLDENGKIERKDLIKLQRLMNQIKELDWDFEL